jgi:hypothetical protein
MGDVTTTRAQSVAALLAIAALVLLLALGAFLAWRSPNVPVFTVGVPAANQSVQGSNGPVDKVAAWIEPPRTPPSAYEIALEQYRLDFEAQKALWAIQQQAASQRDLEAALLYLKRANAMEKTAQAQVP